MPTHQSQEPVGQHLSQLTRLEQRVPPHGPRLLHTRGRHSGMGHLSRPTGIETGCEGWVVDATPLTPCMRARLHRAGWWPSTRCPDRAGGWRSIPPTSHEVLGQGGGGESCRPPRVRHPLPSHLGTACWHQHPSRRSVMWAGISVNPYICNLSCSSATWTA
jgi:hypothetical protein